MRHTKYLEGVLRWYEEQLITPGDPGEGRWENAHTPLPRDKGDDTVLLLRDHHFVHDLWQSKELDELHFYRGQVKDLYRPGWFPADWFELCNIAEKYSSSPLTLKHKQNLSTSHSGKTLTKEHKRKIGDSHTGIKPNWKNKGEYPQMKRPRVKCPVCKRDCANAGALALHIKVHSK